MKRVREYKLSEVLSDMVWHGFDKWNKKVQNTVGFQKRSRVQRFRGSRFHSRPRTEFGMHIYEKSVIFVRPNPKFGAQLAITRQNEHF